MIQKKKIKELYEKTCKVFADIPNEEFEVSEEVLKFFEKYPKFLNIRFFLSNYQKNNIKFLERKNRLSRYISYNKRLEENFDNCYSYTVDSLRFIKEYCKQANIPLHKYPTHREASNVHYKWIHHKHDRYISIYSLCFFPEICRNVLTMDGDDAKYYIEEISVFCKRLAEVDSKQETKNKITKITKLK